MFKGENLKALRMIEGYSRKSLADVLQVSEQAVWQYEEQNMMPENQQNIYFGAKIQCKNKVLLLTKTRII
ncbi:hypothetical protein [Staphylococcus pseudintermedius]